VHYVSAEMDAGPIIGQAAVPVLASDDAETLAARILAQEHKLYPECVRRIACGDVTLGDIARLNIPPADGSLRNPA
jgi:phosphoribosylglycinamide formyltransferase-1